MDLNFDFDEHQDITNVHFYRLDRSKCVTSVKEALAMMKTRSPIVTFSEALHYGEYTGIPDAEYMRMLATVIYLSSLWHYKINY